MSQRGPEQFGAYRKARELFDLVACDVELLKRDSRCYRLISQQVGSADSICADIEEGYGRLSRAEYVRFLDFAPASARETRGCYERMRHCLSDDVILQRVSLTDEIIAIRTSYIENLRKTLGDRRTNHSRVREDPVTYSCSPVAPRHPPFASPHSTLDPDAPLPS